MVRSIVWSGLSVKPKSMPDPSVAVLNDVSAKHTTPATSGGNCGSYLAHSYVSVIVGARDGQLEVQGPTIGLPSVGILSPGSPCVIPTPKRRHPAAGTAAGEG
jgi:hypothetical protein